MGGTTSRFSLYSTCSLILKLLQRLIYNRIYKLVSDSNLIYPLKPGFRQKCSKMFLLTLPKILEKKQD